jgi:hypothetical protein
MWIARVGYQCAYHEVPRINHTAEAVGYFGKEGRYEIERPRARMSPEFLEKLRILGETGELPEEPKPISEFRRI